MTTKKITVLLLALVMVGVMFVGCGSSKNGDKEATLSGNVKVGTSKDLAYNKAVMDKLPDDYKISSSATEDEVISKITSGECELAILSCDGAAKAFNQDSGIKVLSPVYTGGYKIVGNSSTVYLSGVSKKSSDGTTTDTTVTPKNLSTCSVSYCTDLDNYSAIATGLAALDSSSFKISEQSELSGVGSAIASYNYVGLVNLCNSGVPAVLTEADVILDVDEFWKDKVGTPLPTAVLVMSSEFVSERAGDIDAVINDYEKALSKADQKSENGGKAVFYGSSNRGITVLKNYYNKLYTDNSLKGYIPSDDFYYQK